MVATGGDDAAAVARLGAIASGILDSSLSAAVPS